MRASVSRWWPERAEAVCGVPADTLRHRQAVAAAAPVHGGRGAYVLTGRGVEQSTQGTDGVSAAINLAVALGLPGRLGSGYGPLTGQGNGQGGREHGLKSDQLPGYRMIADPAARAHVAAVWGVDPDDLPGPGVPAVELLSRLGTPGGPRALLVHGANPAVSAPNVSAVREALGRLDLLVVGDFVPSETAAMADVVLPVTQWAEEEGTMTTLEGRVVRGVVTRSTRPVRHAPSCGSGPSSPGASATTRPTTPARSSTTWPAPRPGLRRLLGGSLRPARRRRGAVLAVLRRRAVGDALAVPRPLPDRRRSRAHLVAVDHHGPADDVTADSPVHLVTGRLLHHYQSGAQTRRVPEPRRGRTGAAARDPPCSPTPTASPTGCRARHVRAGFSSRRHP